jgi:CRISPR system Cascade subunit CasE
MSWLARLEIDAESIRAEEFSDDIYTWHKMLWQCYPNVPNKTRVDIGFLTRIDQLEGAYRFWVMAKQKPERPQWCPSTGFAVNEISPSFLCHRYYAFDLRANPVKTVVQKDANGLPLLRSNGKWKRGKRVPLIKQDELKAWIIHRGEVRCRDQSTGQDVPGGFRILEDKPLEIRPMVENHFRKKEHTAYHGGVQFRGVLEVTDTARFTDSYFAGIGGAKGFGFGLFLLAPVKL